MRPQNAVRATVAAGWLAGMSLTLAGWPLPAVLGVLAGCTAATAAVLRWGPGMRAGLKAAVRLRRSPGKTGAVVDRA